MAELLEPEQPNYCIDCMYYPDHSLLKKLTAALVYMVCRLSRLLFGFHHTLFIPEACNSLVWAVVKV